MGFFWLFNGILDQGGAMAGRQTAADHPRAHGSPTPPLWIGTDALFDNACHLGLTDTRVVTRQSPPNF
jgi:hypothetical protein